jgi:hypothetical protein
MRFEIEQAAVSLGIGAWMRQEAPVGSDVCTALHPSL